MKIGSTCLLMLRFKLACISSNVLVIIQFVFSQKKKVILAQQLQQLIEGQHSVIEKWNYVRPLAEVIFLGSSCYFHA